MRATTRFATWIALLSCFAIVNSAGAAAGAPSSADEQTAGDDRAAVVELLRQARAAMQQGDLDTADSLVWQAEQKPAKFGVFHLGDTPKKARRDLDRLRQQTPTPALPSQNAKPHDNTEDLRQPSADNPFGVMPSGGPDNPMAGTPASVEARLRQGRVAPSRKKAASALVTPESAAASTPGQMPRPRRASKTSDSPFGTKPITAPPAEEQTTTPVAAKAHRPAMATTKTPAEGGSAGARALLLDARRAVAVRDVRRAARLVAQAKGLKPSYGPHDDTPDKVEALLQKHEMLSQASAEKGDTESFRRELANFLMEQSEGLLHGGDLEQAERLATDASQLGVQFGPYDAQPAELLDRIQKVRGRGPGALAGTAGEAARSTAEAQTNNEPARPDFEPEAARARVGELTAQARVALAAGDLATAGRLAHQAVALKVPDSLFARNEDRPQFVLLEVETARGKQAAQKPGPKRPPAKLRAPESGPVDSGVRQASYDDHEPADQSGANHRADRTAGFQFPDDQAAEPFGNPAPAAGDAPAPRDDGQGVQDQPAGRAGQLLERAEAALVGGDSNTALLYLRKAQAFRQELSPDEQRRLDKRLADLKNSRNQPTQAQTQSSAESAAGSAASTAPAPAPDAPAPEAAANGPAAEAAAASASDAAQSAGESAMPLPLPATQNPGALLGEASEAQKLLKRKVATEVARRESAALQMKEEDPRKALETLKQAREVVETSGLDEHSRGLLLRRLDRSQAEVEAFLEAHQADIELKDKNQATLETVDRERQVKVEVDEKLAKLVDEFNRLTDEQRFAEAEVIAKKAGELAPDNAVVKLIKSNARMRLNYERETNIRDQKAAGFEDAMYSVNASSRPFDDSNPIKFGKVEEWEALTVRRKKLAEGDRPHRNERELEIERKLRTPVSLQFQSAALSEVMEHLAKLTEVNLYLDPEGLAAEGVTTDTPVSIDLPQEIMFKSALNLILEPLHLGYVIKDEVLKITSEQFRDGEIIPVTYPVADLVIPIPNFVPGPRMGLAQTLHDAYGSLGYGYNAGFGSQASSLAMVASKDGAPNSAVIDSKVLASVGTPGTMATTPGGPNQAVGAGPGGAGGGVQADFDSLINLITSTIAPTTWDDVGGSGAIEPFRGNLSLVISQTEDVHDQIRDLLAQLRRLQDLQVTIEVRFITLNDNFFERIGINFDFNINNPAGKVNGFGEQVLPPNDPSQFGAPPLGSTASTAFFGNPRNFAQQSFKGNTTVVGLQQPNVFNADLDIPFTQNNFSLAVPQFGGFDPTAGASIGFAILSDIEAFFFLNAAQGDRRSNVLQAPKVTLFNGQSATVADTSQSPFVISVIPVVGDFAAAQQPVIVVLSEGTFMTVQATVSSDRRFVRLTVVPFFSNIGEVNTFTFEGSSTSTNATSSDGSQDSTTKRSNNTTTTSQGTTVQLPTFSFVTVTTTVSVPDGGTVLLGGIKRLQEGRSEFGVPILNKLPYINRLFQNASIGRTTQSLMMMVTPRIIIQEEEEALLGLPPTTP